MKDYIVSVYDGNVDQTLYLTKAKSLKDAIDKVWATLYEGVVSMDVANGYDPVRKKNIEAYSLDYYYSEENGHLTGFFDDPNEKIAKLN